MAEDAFSVLFDQAELPAEPPPRRRVRAAPRRLPVTAAPKDDAFLDLFGHGDEPPTAVALVTARVAANVNAVATAAAAAGSAAPAKHARQRTPAPTPAPKGTNTKTKTKSAKKTRRTDAGAGAGYGSHGLAPVNLQPENALAVPTGGPKAKARIPPQPVLDTIASMSGRGLADGTARAADATVMQPQMQGANMPRLHPGMFDELELRARANEVADAEPSTLKRHMALTLREYANIKMLQARGPDARADTDAGAGASASAAAAAAASVAAGGTPADDPAPPSRLATVLDDYFRGEWEAPAVGAAHEMQEHLRTVNDLVGKARDLEEEARRVVEDQDTRRVAANAAVIPPPSSSGATGTDDVLALATTDPRNVEFSRLECIDRVYASAFLRQAVHDAGERDCVRGADCVFMAHHGGVHENLAGEAHASAFVCREFLLPSQEVLREEDGTLPGLPRMCLGCNRYWTTALYFAYHASGEQPTTILQDHYVLVEDSDAGYDPSFCLPMVTSTLYTGIVLPFLRYVPRAYDPYPFEIQTEDGTTWERPGVHERGTVFRTRPSSYDLAVAEHHADQQEFASALARGDMRAAADAETRLYARNETDRSASRRVAPVRLVVSEAKYGEATARVRIPPEPWVAGPPELEVVGLPRASPFRPLAYLEAEAECAPLSISAKATPLRELTPRVLLGQLYPTFADTIFCPFDQTVAIAPSSFARMLGSRIRATPTTLYGLPRTPVLDDVLADPSSCAIVAALLLRVHVATTLMRVAATPDTRYILTLFMDTHLDLADTVRQFELYRDSELSDGLFNRMGIDSIMSSQNPHDMRFSDSGSLPDISSCLPHAAIFYNTDSRHYSGTIMEAIVHMLADKSQPQKCKGRNFIQIIRQYRRKHPQLMTLIRSLIIVSLLGNYTHAKFRPCFAARINVMRLFSQRYTCDDTIMKWIAENGDIVYAIVKEFYRFTVTLDPAFETVLLVTTYWNTVQRTYALAMDRVRSAFDMSFLCGGGASLHTACMSMAVEELERLHTRCGLACASKLRKGQFVSALVKEMNHYFSIHILRPNIAKPQNSLLLLSEIVGRETTELILRAMYYVISTRVAQHFAREPVEFFWLTLFGMDRQCLTDVRALAYDFEHKETADKAVSSRIAAIYTRKPQDFFILHVYCIIIGEWRSRQSFAMPENYREAQDIALRAKWHVPPWDDLPATAYTMHYCPNCKRPLADVVDGSIPDTRIRMASTGARKSMYYAKTGRLYCASQRVPVATRGLFERGVYDDLERHIPDTTEAKRARNFAETPPCSNTPAIAIDMRGRVQLLGGSMYALCTKCGCICKWMDHRIGSMGFTCGFHGANSRPPKTVRQEDLAVVRAKRATHSIIDNCSYCDNTITAKSDYSRFTVFDDINTRAYIRYTLCTTCAAPFTTWAPLRLRSHVNRVIELRRAAFQKARPNFGITRR